MGSHSDYNARVRIAASSGDPDRMDKPINLKLKKNKISSSPARGKAAQAQAPKAPSSPMEGTSGTALGATSDRSVTTGVMVGPGNSKAAVTMLETAGQSVAPGAECPSNAGTAAKPTLNGAGVSRPGSSGERRQAATKDNTGGVAARETTGASSQDKAEGRSLHAEKRKAAKTLKKYDGVRLDTLPPSAREAVERAKVLLPNFQTTAGVSVENQSLSKRQRSVEEQQPPPKKFRTHSGAGRPSFAEVARDRILIGVLDRGNELGSIPRDQWRWVKAALANVIFDVLMENPGTPPACRDAGWYQGHIKVVACDDARSVALYKAAVAKVGAVYPGANLEVVDWKDIPVRPRARAWVPVTPSSPESILKMLQLMNPALPTSDWRVLRVEDPDGPSRQVVLSLNRDSIELLERRQGRVFYGLDEVTLKVYRGDAQRASGASASVEVDIEAPEPEGDLSDAESSASTESNLASSMRRLCEEELLLSDGEGDADVTVIAVEEVAGTSNEGSANQPPQV